MKNLITIIAVVFTLTVNAQQTTNQFAVLSPGFNFPSKGGTNQIAEDYAATGKLPQGMYIATAQQIANSRGANGMWVEYNQAADVNTEIDGGHYQKPNEQFIMNADGSMYCAVVCGNTIKDVNFYGKITVNSITVVQNQVDLKPLHDEHATINSNVVALNTKVDALTAGQAQLGQNQQIILAGIQSNSNSLATVLTNQEDILANTAAAAKYARQSRNIGYVNLGLNALNTTVSTIDLLNGDGGRNVSTTINNLMRFPTSTPVVTPSGPSLDPSN